MIGLARAAESPNSSRVAAAGVTSAPAVSRVSVPAYRVELSDYARSAMLERQRLKKRTPRAFKDNFDIKKEFTMRQEEALKKTNAGGSTRNAAVIDEVFQKRQKAIVEASAAFRRKSELLHARLQTRMMYGPNVTGRQIRRVIGPDGGLYMSQISLEFEAPSASNNALNDFHRAQGLRTSALNPNLPGGVNWGVASKASLAAFEAYNQLRADARTRARVAPQENLFADEIKAQETKRQAKLMRGVTFGQQEGMFAEEIKLRQAKREAARKAELKAINAKLAGGTDASEAVFTQTWAGKAEAEALQSEVAYFGLAQGNIPKNYKTTSVKGIAYDATYGRHTNTTLTSPF